MTSATLPSSGRVPVDLGRLRHRLADLDHLAGDVGGAGREQEAQGRVDLLLGALGDVDQLHGDAAADLLAERAGEALQRPLRGRRRGPAGRPAGVPSTTTRPERCTRFTLGWKKRCSSTSSVESAMPVASKTSALTGRVDGLGLGRADLAQQPLDLLAEPAARGAAAEHGAGDDRRAGLLALQLRRLGQADPAGDHPARGRVDYLCVEVAHRCSPPVLSSAATTPWPPAAQMLIRPRPEPCSCRALARLATIRPPVAAKGWPAASEPPLTLSRSRSIAPSGFVAAEAVAAEGRVLPGLQRAEHLGGEGLVDLVEVEVAEAAADAVEHARHRVGRRHQQPLALVHVVDRRGLAVDEVGEDRQVALLRPLLAGQQHRRGAVAERGRVGGGHRALGAAEDRAELGQLLRRGVGAQVLVALEAEVGADQVVHEAALVGGGEVVVAAAPRARPAPRGRPPTPRP